MSSDSSAVGPRLRGRRLVLARVGWGILVVLALGFFVAAVPAYYRRLSAPPDAVQMWLAQAGLAVDAFAAYLTALTILFAAGNFAVAVLIVWRKSDDGMALFVALFLVLLGAVNAPNMAALEELHPALFVPAQLANFLAYTSLLLLIYLFPDGRFAPRVSAALALGGIAGLAVGLWLTGNTMTRVDSALVGLILLGALTAGMVAQIYRYARISTPTQRQQTKWVILGLAVAVAGYVGSLVVEAGFPALSPPGFQATPYDMVGVTTIVISNLFIPLTIGIAILRYRLWDIDLLLNRTLVYGALTAGGVGLYALIVGGVGALVQARGNVLLALLATGLIAVLFAPLRARLQRGVNHLMYGERDDPYAVLARLGRRLEATLAPEAVLPAIVQTVAEALKLPYVGIALRQDEAFTVVAAIGTPVDAPVRLPLTYQHETIGELLLAPRAPGEGFGPADRRLLDDLARQAGVAAHAVRLTADLRRSRERLVAAREEERRRLRRDLHDGLGPALAAQTLKVGSARLLLARDPAAADALLAELEADLDAALADIRRLVYNLRPPALDELGLAAAIGELAAQYGPRHAGDDTRLTVIVDAPDRLPPLPAAVEVAAYRIAQEALTNVVRHARARTCHVRLALDDGLCLEIADDGRGLPPDRQTGVGLLSMRERATELGGVCSIAPIPTGGTRVLARLPLPPGAGDGDQEAACRPAAIDMPASGEVTG